MARFCGSDGRRLTGSAAIGSRGALRAGDDVLQPVRALAKLGVWDRLFEAVARAYEGDVQMVDSSSIRVHQHAANGKRGVRRTPPGTTLTPDAWGARVAGCGHASLQVWQGIHHAPDLRLLVGKLASHKRELVVEAALEVRDPHVPRHRGRRSIRQR